MRVLMDDFFRNICIDKKDYFCFQFTFDGFLSDICIVYDINNPEKWACDNSYRIGSKEFSQIVRAIKLYAKLYKLYNTKV